MLELLQDTHLQSDLYYLMVVDKKHKKCKKTLKCKKNIVVIIVVVVVLLNLILILQIFYHAKSGGYSFKIDWVMAILILLNF